MSQKIALVVGSTGIVGRNLAEHLIRKGWSVLGLARKPIAIEGLKTIAADLLDKGALANALKDARPTHVFITTWMRQSTEAENIKVNSAMVRNLLEVLSRARSVEHVALVTGLKHYLGPFEAYGKGKMPPTPYREDQPRLDVPNFYYAQEDEIFKAAEKDGFSWSVHRPHTIIGYALGNAMNMGVTLAVYANICKELKRPFQFPGSSAQWNGVTDMTDARLLAHHLEWASTESKARNQAFNVVNGDVFRWSWMWEKLANYFGVERAPFNGTVIPLESQLANADGEWAKIANAHHLVEPNLKALISAWHTDADLGRPLEVIADMTKSRKLGFKEYQATDESFYDLFASLKKSKVIP